MEEWSKSMKLALVVSKQEHRSENCHKIITYLKEPPQECDDGNASRLVDKEKRKHRRNSACFNEPQLCGYSI